MDNLTKLKSTHQTYRAVAHPLRQRIIDLLKEGDNYPTDIYIKLREDQSLISQHLRILRNSGIVKVKERQGKHLLYSLDRLRYAEVVNLSKVLYP